MQLTVSEWHEYHDDTDCRIEHIPINPKHGFNLEFEDSEGVSFIINFIQKNVPHQQFDVEDNVIMVLIPPHWQACYLSLMVCTGGIIYAVHDKPIPPSKLKEDYTTQQAILAGYFFLKAEVKKRLM